MFEIIIVVGIVLIMAGVGLYAFADYMENNDE